MKIKIDETIFLSSNYTSRVNRVIRLLCGLFTGTSALIIVIPKLCSVLLEARQKILFSDRGHQSCLTAYSAESVSSVQYMVASRDSLVIPSPPHFCPQVMPNACYFLWSRTAFPHLRQFFWLNSSSFCISYKMINLWGSNCCLSFGKTVLSL